jgi:PAS domain S-box-containing protein
MMDSPATNSNPVQAVSFEEKLFPLFEDAAVGFGKVGLDCSWLRVNRKLCEMTGYSEEELLGMTFIEMTHPSDVQADLENMQAVMAGELPINVMEKRYIHKNGSVIWIHLTATLTRTSQGRPDYFIVIVEDITARKEAEEALRKSNRDLEQFATLISHDLLAPLRKVVLFGDALKASGDGLNDEQRDYIDRMQRSAHRMQQLISDLLNLSRIDRKGQPFRKSDLKRIVEAATGDLQDELEQVGGEVVLGEIDIRLEVDAVQLKLLFGQLLENALKFRKQGLKPVVRIEAQVLPNGMCEISFQDNGIGFDEAHNQRIFGVFERLNGGHDYEGTGIGLAICQKIAQRHSGTIRANSKPGVGSVFIVSLPVLQPPGV